MSTSEAWSFHHKNKEIVGIKWRVQKVLVPIALKWVEYSSAILQLRGNMMLKQEKSGLPNRQFTRGYKIFISDMPKKRSE